MLPTAALRGPPRPGGTDGDAPDTRIEPDVDRTSGEGRAVVCARCGHRITDTKARIAVRGEHRHVCVNPSGIPFEIGCFCRAPGCRPHGAPQSYWSWFAGYSWQIVLCGGCSQHVGWAFVGAEPSFHGLILARIVERSEPDAGDD